MKELLRIRRDHLSKLWVAGAKLLEDRFEHLRLLVYKLSQLLELRVVAQEVKVAWSGCGSGAWKVGTSSGGATTRLSTLSCLSRGLEEINTFVAGCLGGFLSWLCRRLGGSSGCRLRRLRLPIFANEVIGDTLRLQSALGSLSLFHLLRSSFILTVSKYSTARFGLKKAARIARSISARSNPIDSIFAIAAARSVPRAIAFVSVSDREGSLVATGAGVGVAGAFCVVVVEGAGAAGAAGV